MILGLQSGFAAVAASSEGAGAARRLSGWCGYDSRDSLYLGLVSAEAKAAYLVHLLYVVSAGPSKTSERAQPGRSGIYRAKREATNIEKVGPTRFFNLFRTEFSFSRFVMTMVCKRCPREKLPPHFAKSGGKRL